MEGMLCLLEKYDRSSDGTIGEQELTTLVKALDTGSFWDEAKLTSLMKGFGLDAGRLKLTSFAQMLFEGPQSALYQVVREDLRKAMTSPEWDDGSYAPILIRLAWHSSGTYNKADGTGGSNGATMRHALEASDPENAYLEHARGLLEPVKVKHPWISYADLWILAAYVALEITRGPRIAFTGGRVDAPEEKAVAPGRLPGAEYGLAEGMEVDEEGRLKGWENLAQHIRDVFGRMGLTDREAVALICGGHVYGRCHPEQTASGYAGAWVEMPTLFSNEYAADMVGDRWMAVTHDTVMPDGGRVPEEVRPAPGKRQYIDLTKYEGEEEEEAAQEAPDAKEYPPGRYKCTSQWVNIHEQPDVSSPVHGRCLEGEELSFLAVKVFGTELRGLAERGGWISLTSGAGKPIFERVANLEPEHLQGRYRVRIANAPLLEAPSASALEVGRKQAGEEVTVEEVRIESSEGSNISIMGRLEVGGRSGWVTIYSSDGFGGLVCERIVEGYNERPRRPLKGQTGHQMMLVSDMVLLWDAAFREHLEAYAEDEDLLKREFGEAFKKLTELGCPWSKDAPGPATGCAAVAPSRCPFVQ
ncbi:unnamed protein product [Symbiodinium pilosum]|uniref:Uncharacterized protein n=1 Tax=Symbiodinium pilosum TaxID=2952 RepID=A0A812VM45_SYMPI|nr:unnamed protein product [Symbiodinium pilosum]